MKIGIIAAQGAVTEHIEMVQRALSDSGKSGRAVSVRVVADMEGVSALIIPGGESTTIAKALHRTGLAGEIARRAEEGMPVMGTCAGCVLLAKEGDEEVAKTQTRLLGLMDMAVDRNAFGRQRDSFETELEIDGMGTFRAVFIRAPKITKVWGGCKPLSKIRRGAQDEIVMARQGSLLALSFHPELTSDPRIHRMFIEMV